MIARDILLQVVGYKYFVRLHHC